MGRSCAELPTSLCTCTICMLRQMKHKQKSTLFPRRAKRDWHNMQRDTELCQPQSRELHERSRRKGKGGPAERRGLEEWPARSDRPTRHPSAGGK
ncbi:hypothetical protein BCV70DRAFT_4966 [Testicularia cyperi]|uniref:Uncharacterized protein n=1 Tax=Testicularia cyperi TaxID=1882483 RepID=A0A317XWR8_9BASI|nr:hypothetical protein BCV70DRAFT_4966 [Testicularia cyperi]